jgi:hypothetical protein
VKVLRGDDLLGWVGLAAYLECVVMFLGQVQMSLMSGLPRVSFCSFLLKSPNLAPIIGTR